MGSYGGVQDLNHEFTEAEAMAGDAEEQVWLAKTYLWGIDGVERNYEAADMWMQRAADQGNSEALYNVGVLHLYGYRGKTKNVKLAK